MRFFCIADEDTVRGFRLAGVDGRAVTGAPEASEALGEATRQAEIGIVVMTEAAADGIRPQIDAARLAHDRPLIVVIPGPSGPSPGRSSLHQLVQAAVGVQVRMGKEG